MEGSSFVPGAAASRRPVGSGARRVFVPARLALVRLRAHAWRNVVVSIGIAVGAAVLAMTAVGAVAVQDRAVQQALGALAPSDRSVQAVWSGVPAQSSLSYPQLDRLARNALEPVLHRPAFAVEVFRQATWGGAFVNLGAVDGLSRWIALRSGRLPRLCTPADCELVQVGGKPVAPRLPFLHVVGHATFRAGAPLAAYFAAAGSSRPPILLANGVLPFTRTPLPDAPDIARTYGWIVPVEPGAIHDWDLASLGARIDQAQAQLEERSDIFGVNAPLDTIAAVRATSRVAGQRLLILGGDAAVLLLGFAVLASTRLRRDHDAVRQRLTWLGARRGQILLVAAAEVAAITIVSSVVGWIAGSGAGALLARHLGEPGWPAVEHALLSLRAFGVAAALAALTALVMLAALRMERIAFGGLTLTAADVAALGALGAILLALARGKTDTSTLASNGGTGVVLLLLPGLVLFVLAVAAARLLSPLLRVLEWAGRRGPHSLRLALLSLARSPGRVLLSVVFFVLSVGVALFAIAYRATLERGEVEQARYAVPAPYVLSEDLQQARHRAAGGAAAVGVGTPVLRDDGFISANRGIDFTLLALPASSVAGVDGWRSDFSSLSPAALGKLLAPPVPPRLRGFDLSRRATTLTLPVTVTGDLVDIELNVLDRRGDFTLLDFGEVGRGTHTRTVRLPKAARGGRVIAMRLSFPLLASFAAGHRESGTALSVNDASVGTLRFDRRFAGWVGSNGIRVRGTTLRYVVNRAADSILRPREPLEGAPVPVIVSPRSRARRRQRRNAAAQRRGRDDRGAGRRGREPLPVRRRQTSSSPICRRGSRLRTRSSRAPRRRARSGCARPQPAALTASLDGRSRRARRSRHSAATRSRVDRLPCCSWPPSSGSRSRPSAILLGVVGDRRDETGELFDLEAQGVTPAELRRHLLLRALVVAVVGIAAGVAAGAVVSALVVAVVSVTAGAGSPLPPLTLSFDWPLVGIALACPLPSARDVRSPSAAALLGRTR